MSNLGAIVLAIVLSAYAMLMSYAQPKFARPYAWVSGLGIGVMWAILVELVLLQAK